MPGAADMRDQWVEVNGHRYPTDGWEGARLIDFLRLRLGLTGTKEGCGEGECGACTVLVDRRPMCACLVLCGCVGGRSVLTVEGLPPHFVSTISQAFATTGGVQCGFCTPGMAVMAYWIHEGHQGTGHGDLPKLLEGNLCRCTGYWQLMKVMTTLARESRGCTACQSASPAWPVRGSTEERYV
ncbi:MAG: 2Fe-2S iron-sulfur cluster-binding protein [Armatimonadota bacterium]|nr:2Fe-2S iron-sulfur cluster-binding protein [Armatimonadota bacterium]